MSEKQPLEPSGSAFRLPPQPMVMDVTPDMASDWLSYRNHPKNRPLSKSVAGKYQADMESGRWALTPEGLIFDTDGYIISGQHRLKAVANSGKTIEFWVFPGESRDIFDVVDQGYKRTAAHVLRVPHAVSIANASHIPIGAHLAVLAQAARTEHIGRIQSWLDALHTGADLPPGDARLLLRNRFQAGVQVIGGANRRDLAYALIVKAWNAYAVLRRRLGGRLGRPGAGLAAWRLGRLGGRLPEEQQVHLAPCAAGPWHRTG
jgi:hypothetical protein